MKDIQAIEENAETVNGCVYWAYLHAKDNGNELLDFSDVIWDKDVKEIADFFKANGIKEFTISSTYSGLLNILAEFEKVGFQVAGLTKVKASIKDFNTKQYENVPAIRMEVR